MENHELNDDLSDEQLQHTHGDFVYPLTEDTECHHHFWIKRCSLCKAILESDATVNLVAGTDTRISYTELIPAVCTWKLSRKLKAAHVQQKSLLYWVYLPDDDILTLRTKSHSSKMKNAEITSAFIASELVTLLLKKDVMHSVLSGNTVVCPDKLARLLLQPS